MTRPLTDDPVAQEVERRLQRLRDDPQALLARFDRDGDGVLDAEEWRVARDVVRREVETQSEGTERLDDRYRIVTPIGSGSQGHTYLAVDEETGEFVAVKEVRLATAKGWDATERFDREVAILGGLAHPQIPKLLDTIRLDDETPRMLMVQSFVEGDTLAAKLREGKLFDEAQLLDIARQLLDILGYLHRQTPAVIHRDVKPDNVIIGPDGTLHLVDFGAAQGLEDREAVGTNGYMAPEQLTADAVPASDVYGAGATLVHLATRKHPSSMLEGLRLEWRSFASLSEPTARWLDRMVAPDAEDRFFNAISAGKEMPRTAARDSSKQALTERAPSAIATDEFVRDRMLALPTGSRYMVRRDGDHVVIEIPPEGLFSAEFIAAAVFAAIYSVYILVRAEPMSIEWLVPAALLFGVPIIGALRNPIQKIRIEPREISLVRARGTKKLRVPSHHVMEAKVADVGSYGDTKLSIRTVDDGWIRLARSGSKAEIWWLDETFAIALRR